MVRSAPNPDASFAEVEKAEPFAVMQFNTETKKLSFKLLGESTGYVAAEVFDDQVAFKLMTGVAKVILDNEDQGVKQVATLVLKEMARLKQAWRIT